MKVALQDKKTGCFFAGKDRWVPGFDDATDFGNSVEAEEFAHREKLSNVQIIIKTEGGSIVTIALWKQP